MNNNPAIFLQDRFGTWIKFDQYGTTSKYGWEIDHIWPLSLGGLLGTQNEVATHWSNNHLKSNQFIVESSNKNRMAGMLPAIFLFAQQRNESEREAIETMIYLSPT